MKHILGLICDILSDLFFLLVEGIAVLLNGNEIGFVFSVMTVRRNTQNNVFFYHRSSDLCRVIEMSFLDVVYG